MARSKAPNPDELIADLKAKQMKVAVERDEAKRLTHAAYAALAIPERGPNTVGIGTIHALPAGELTIPERFKAAEAARALEREHEPLEAIEKAERAAHEALRINSRRFESLSDAVNTRGEEIEQLEADHRDYFVARAEEGSRGGEEQLDKLIAVFDETQQTLGDMWGRWTRVNIPISTDDMSHIRHQLTEVKRTCCWPQHSEAKYRASQQAPPAPKLSNSESGPRVGSHANPPTGPAPLIEVI